MKAWNFAIVALIMGLIGCSKGITGVYRATITEPTKTDLASKNKHELLSADYGANPRTIEFDGNTFRLSVGNQLIQTGSCRIEGDKVVLRAQMVKGAPVLEALQVDLFLKRQSDGSLLDDHTYAVDGINVIFRPD